MEKNTDVIDTARPLVATVITPRVEVEETESAAHVAAVDLDVTDSNYIELDENDEHAEDKSALIQVRSKISDAMGLLKDLNHKDEFNALDDLLTRLQNNIAELDLMIAQSCVMPAHPPQLEKDEVDDAADNAPDWKVVPRTTNEAAEDNAFIIQDESLTLYRDLNVKIVPTNYAVTFSKARPPVQGVRNICAIMLDWNSAGSEEKAKDKGNRVQDVVNMGKTVTKIYSDLSRGLLQMKFYTFGVSVPFARSPANLKKAESYAKRVANQMLEKKFPNQKIKFDFYNIVNNGVSSGSRTNGGICHLYGTNPWTAAHENGHGKFGLGHSGRYTKDPKNPKKIIYQSSGDVLCSFMTTGPSTQLAACQLDRMGWIFDKEEAIHNPESPETEYPMTVLDDRNPDGFLRAVKIPRSNAKDIYLSVVQDGGKYLYALHLQYSDPRSAANSGGGSMRVALFGASFTYDNLVFTRNLIDGNHSTIKIGPKFAGV